MKLPVLALTIAGMLVAEAALAAPFDRTPWLADYAFLKSALERQYSNLAWFASPEGGVDLPALDRRTMRALKEAQSEADARAAILDFVRGFGDGHFGVVPTPQAVAPAPEPAPRAADADAESACEAFGYAPRTQVSFSLPFESLAGFSLIADGITDAFRAGSVVVGGKRIGIVRIPRFRPAEYPALCRHTWTRLHASGQTVTAALMSQEVQTDWLAALAERLRRFTRDHVDVVIVDVAGDGGGNDLGDWAVRLFTARDVRSEPLLLTQGPVAVPYFDEQIAALSAVLHDNADLSPPTKDAATRALADFEGRKAMATQPPCAMSWVWHERRAWRGGTCRRLIEGGFASGAYGFAPPTAFDAESAQALYWAAIADPWRGAWTGPVYVLTDERTGSSAEMFTAQMHDVIGARTIGAHTLGTGCGFMDVSAPLVLPHSRLAFAVPNCVRLRADGTDEVTGIAPDVPVLPRDGESDRARAMRVLRAVSGQ